MEGVEVTRSGRLFQTRGKALSLTVRSRVRLTINDEDELEPVLILTLYVCVFRPAVCTVQSGVVLCRTICEHSKFTDYSLIKTSHRCYWTK